MKLKDKRILVSGAGGFIGSHLVEGLVKEGARIKGFVRYNSRNDSGLLELLPAIIRKNKKDIIIDYEEKSTLNYLVSTGIYIFEPEVLRYIRPKEKLDFPELVKKLICAKKKVYTYISQEYWLDIGRELDYRKAIEDSPKTKSKLIA